MEAYLLSNRKITPTVADGKLHQFCFSKLESAQSAIDKISILLINAH